MEKNDALKDCARKRAILCLIFANFSLSRILVKIFWRGGSLSVADPGCLYRILDLKFFITDLGSKSSRIRIKEFKYF
jgi:hypothetical protein